MKPLSFSSPTVLSKSAFSSVITAEFECWEEKMKLIVIRELSVARYRAGEKWTDFSAGVNIAPRSHWELIIVGVEHA